MAASVQRVALLSSFTLDALPPLVDRALEGDGPAPSWYVGPFNQYRQMILDPQSELYRFEPQVVFLAVDTEDLFAELPDASAGESTARLETAERCVQAYSELIATLAERLGSATIVVHNLARQRPQPHPLLAYASPAGIGALVDRANLALAERAEKTANLLVLDVRIKAGLETLSIGHGVQHSSRGGLCNTKMVCDAARVFPLCDHSRV